MQNTEKYLKGINFDGHPTLSEISPLLKRTDHFMPTLESVKRSFFIIIFKCTNTERFNSFPNPEHQS